MPSDGSQMAAVLGAGLDDDPANVLGEDFKLLLAEQLDVGRRIDFFQHALVNLFSVFLCNATELMFFGPQ